MPHRLWPLVVALLCAAAHAQNVPITSVRIYTEPPGARFYVDGEPYSNPQVFLWPQGSKHILQFPTANDNGVSTGCQVSRDLLSQFCFGGWTDSTGTLQSGTSGDVTVTASPSLTWIKAVLSPKYRVAIRFLDAPQLTGLECGAPGNAPQDVLRTGVVFVAGNCYVSNTDVWLGGAVSINAFPFPGFVFNGWSWSGAQVPSFLGTVNIDRPGTLYAQFVAARRVQFITNPPGLKLLIDRTPTPTTSKDQNDNLSANYAPCKQSLNLPPQPPVTIPALCFGEFDFLPGSKHIFAAQTPQFDDSGKYYVFDKFSNGLEQNGVYTADSAVSQRDVITASFVRGVQAAFLTNPPGLKLSVDGRDNWPTYSFVWASGSKHAVSAPLTQVDANGRRWTFEGWSNGGTAALEVVADSPDSGIRLTANYSGLGQLKVTTNPPGIKLNIDGGDCVTPCSVDRQAGTEVVISAPASVAMDPTSRLEFVGWSDGAPLAHSVSVPAEPKTLFANYNRAYRLQVVSDPAGGVDFSTDPYTTDFFFPVDTVVSITANARPGFRFRRWGGDVAGVYNVAQLRMDAPRAVLASLEQTPYIAPAGIKNAAGETPSKTVAPGSIISIFGESLAPRAETGPRNPLAQTLADVVVTVNDRFLPLLFVSPQQINAQVLSDLPDGEYTLRVRWTGKPDVTGTFTISRNSPGLFSKGDPDAPYSMAIHEDGTPVSPDSPANRGEIVTVYGTGFGPFNQRIIDGFAFPDTPAFQLVDPVEISAGDAPIRPEWSGGAAGFAGMTATRFRIPSDLPSTPLVLSVKVNGKASNTVPLPVQNTSPPSVPTTAPPAVQ